MILVISALASSRDGAQQLTSALNEPVKICPSLVEAIGELQSREFSAVVFDQLLLDAEPEVGNTVLKLIDGAVAVYVNFALSGQSRLLRELRSATERRKREALASRTEAQRALRHDLKNTATALLLSCEAALQVPELPAGAICKMQDVRTLAQEMTSQLEEAAS